MLDIAWTEMLVIVVVTILVVGPKDLPKVLKAVGGLIGKARSFAARFQSDLDALARESELDDLRKQARAYQAKLMDPKGEIGRMMDPTTGVPTAPDISADATGSPPASAATPAAPGESEDKAAAPAGTDQDRG